MAKKKEEKRKCKRIFEASGNQCTRNALPDGEFCQRCQTTIKKNPAPAVEEWTLNVSKPAFIDQMRGMGITDDLESMDQTELPQLYSEFDSTKIKPEPEPEPEQLELPEVTAGKSMLDKWDDIGHKKNLAKAASPGKGGGRRFWMKPKDPRTIAKREISRMKLTAVTITIYCIYGPKWTWKRGEII